MRIQYLCLLLFALFERLAAQQQIPPAFEFTARQNEFLKNVGQVRDFDNRSVDFVYYQANLGNQQIFITKYGLSILLSRVKKIKRIYNGPKTNISHLQPSSADSLTIANYEMERIDIVLKDAIINSKNITTTTDAQSPYFNFYIDRAQTNMQRVQLQNAILD